MMSSSKKQMRFVMGVGVVCAVSSLPVFAGEAHEHGVGHLDMVLEGNTLQAQLTTPAANVVGFEHAPKTDAEKSAVATAIAALNKVESVFAMPVAANCTLSALDVDAEGLMESDHDHDHEGHDDHEEHADHHEKHEHDHEHHAEDAHEHEGDEHDHDDHDHEHEGHMDMSVGYAWQCENPEALSGLEMTLFKNFPSFEEVRVQLVDATQRALTLTPSVTGLPVTP